MKRALPSGPFTIETEFDGHLSVCDEQANALATFIPELREFAEEMRDRLMVRWLTRLADERRCPVCGIPAVATCKPLYGPAFWTHADGTLHLAPLAAQEHS